MTITSVSRGTDGVGTVTITILQGHCIDVMREMPDASVQAIISSPPYWRLRDYGTSVVEWDDWSGELGQESTPQAFVAHLIDVFREARRLLAPNGLLWVNLGDTYAKGLGIPHKSLVGIPWRFALAMIDDGWILRQDIIWHKPNPLPESVIDRCTKAHEYVFMFAKSSSYYWDASVMQEDAVRPPKINSASKKLASAYDGTHRPGAHSGLTRDHLLTGKRNRRSVWTVPVGKLDENHYAAWPRALVMPMILASTRAGDTVLDPFSGSGTTASVASSLGRVGIGIELNPEYVQISQSRASRTQMGLQMDSQL